MGFAAQAIQGKYDKDAAREAAKLAEKQQKASMQLINELDYEPVYASQTVPTYQRSQSPVARSYIESFLMGNNPDAIMSTSPNAKINKARAQQAQNQMFGTPEERLAKQNAYFAETPWKVTAPTRSVKSTFTPEAAFTGQNADLAAVGIDKQLDDSLRDTGTNLAQLKAQSQAGNRGSRDAMLAFADEDKALSALMKIYGGDTERLSADIRSAGGVQKLAKQRGV